MEFYGSERVVDDVVPEAAAIAARTLAAREEGAWPTGPPRLLRVRRADRTHLRRPYLAHDRRAVQAVDSDGSVGAGAAWLDAEQSVFEAAMDGREHAHCGGVPMGGMPQ